MDACNAHARRKFFDARSTDPARAHAALAFYRQLYGVERDIQENSSAWQSGVAPLRVTPSCHRP
jgi:hypothetical protein